MKMFFSIITALTLLMLSSTYAQRSKSTELDEITMVFATWEASQIEYAEANGKVGDCIKIKFTPPGAEKPINFGKSNNYSYECYVKGNVAYFKAKNKDKIDDCPSGEILEVMFDSEKDNAKISTASTKKEDCWKKIQYFESKKESSYNLMKDKNFAKDIDRALKNVAGLQTSGKTELGDRRGSVTSGFDGYAEGGSGGIGDMLGGLMGGSADSLGTKAKGSLKAPSARDIDMGNGDGSRSKAEIMAVANARMPGLRNIYNKYLKLKPGFSGKVTLKFTIIPSGDIVSISIVSSTTGYAEFDNAIKNTVATWKWKVIKSGDTTPTIPFNFTE
jgi:TonB family protein